MVRRFRVEGETRASGKDDALAGEDIETKEVEQDTDGADEEQN